MPSHLLLDLLNALPAPSLFILESILFTHKHTVQFYFKFSTRVGIFGVKVAGRA